MKSSSQQRISTQSINRARKVFSFLRPFFLLFYLFTFLPFHAQVIDLGKDNTPARKLQIAEMAIKGLYVDQVDEQKLVEDGIRGMLEKLDPPPRRLKP